MALYAALAVGACGGCSPFLTQPAIDPVAKDLAVADGFACGLQGGVPYCWGDASFGATGDGSVPRTTLPALAPVDSLVKFVSVSAGGVDFSSDAGHACGLTATGAVYCWGDNRFGQLGQGTTSPSSSTVPLAVAPGTVFRSISAGGTHSCGVTTAGDVLCWGNDSSWQVGVGANPIGTAAVVATPTRPVFAAPQPSFVSVSAGATHTCAITDTGALWCWGNNQDLQLGVPRNPNLSSRRPVAVGMGAGGSAQLFKQVSAGTSRTCAIDVTDTAFCWGTGFLGGTSPGSSPIPGVAQVAIPGAPPIAAVVTRASHSCALTTAGMLFCWGANDSGQIGNGTAGLPNVFAPTSVGGLGPVTAVSVGTSHTCALAASGFVSCWGSRVYDQIGDDTVTAAGVVPTPTRIAVGAAITGLSAGPYYTCAIGGNGAAFCWGAMNTGELGVAATESCGSPAVPCRTSPVPAVRGMLANQIAASGSHVCVVTNTVNGVAANQIWCWGMNESGQLGATIGGGPTCSSRTGPCWETPPVAPSQASFEWVTGGWNHACGISSGTGYCWGANQRGQIGATTAATCVTTVGQPPIPCANGATNVGPPALPSGTVLRQISAGGAHTCAVDNNGVARCWGDGSSGQLGTPGRTAGAVDLGGRPALAISAGFTHTCALAGDLPSPGPRPLGSPRTAVFCWGANASGEVGDGTTTMRSLPVQVSTGVPGEFAAVGVGAGASCGIVIPVVSSPSQAAPTGGTIVCWGGDGTAAALGRGTAGPTTPGPAPIASTLSFRSVGVGNGVACGRSVDDSVLCWGNNSLGQLGQGPSGPASSAAPLPIVGK